MSPRMNKKAFCKRRLCTAHVNSSHRTHSQGLPPRGESHLRGIPEHRNRSTGGRDGERELGLTRPTYSTPMMTRSGFGEPKATSRIASSCRRQLLPSCVSGSVTGAGRRSATATVTGSRTGKRSAGSRAGAKPRESGAHHCTGCGIRSRSGCTGRLGTCSPFSGRSGIGRSRRRWGMRGWRTEVAGVAGFSGKAAFLAPASLLAELGWSPCCRQNAATITIAMGFAERIGTVCYSS